MARPLLPDDLWAVIEPLLPAEQPKSKGRRPRVPDRAALTGILFVLRSGIPWEMLPKEMGCGSGMTCWRRLREWQEAGVWDRLHRVLLDRLGRAGGINWRRACLDSASVAAKRGVSAPARTRRTGVGRDPRGTSLQMPTASRSPSVSPPPTFTTAVLQGLDRRCAAHSARRGRPRRRPAKLHADKAYDVPRCCEALRWRRVKARIARRGVDSSERLGRHRWVVERTLAWFSRFRRLTVRYERQADMHQAFLSLAASLICWSYVQRRSGEAPIRIAQPAATGRGKVASCPA